MSQTEKQFAEGFIFKRRDNAPDFVVGNLSIKVEEAIAWLKSNSDNGWVNVDIKRAKGGNYYCEKDTWKPNSQTTQATATTTSTTTTTSPASFVEEDELPF